MAYEAKLWSACSLLPLLSPASLLAGNCARLRNPASKLAGEKAAVRRGGAREEESSSVPFVCMPHGKWYITARS